jgi:predicted HicB family RNase H-like nuclease
MEKKMSDKLTRMSIDIAPKDHKKIKMRAAKEGVSIREFVIDCIQDRIEAQSCEKEVKKRK